MLFYILIKMKLLKLPEHYILDLCIALYIKVIFIKKCKYMVLMGKCKGMKCFIL